MDERTWSVYIGGKRLNCLNGCATEHESCDAPAAELPRGSGPFEFTATMTMEVGDWDALSRSTMDTFDPLRVAECVLLLKRRSWPPPTLPKLGSWYWGVLFDYPVPCRIERIQPEDSDGSAWVQVGIYNRFPEGEPVP